MVKHKIAVIIAGIDQSYQSSILDGIQESAKKCHLDIYVFVSFSGTMANDGHDVGELNIFNLPDFSKFDGAILLTNTIDHQPTVENILERIKDAGIPAVSIDNDVEGMFYIGIDNKSAMMKITRHFIDVHGIRDFGYISGPEGNSESEARMSAFKSVLEENGIEIDDKHIYEGDFRGPSGKNAVEKFMRENHRMPKAIICANDVMAVSAINRLMTSGYKVPAEIKISGFDNTYNNHNFQLELTTVDRPLQESGDLACTMLFNYFNDIEQDRSVIFDMSTRFTESCGCCENTSLGIDEYKTLNSKNYSKYEGLQTYMGRFNELSCALLSCNSFEDYIQTFKKFVIEMNPDEFYFCLCDNWNSEIYDKQNIVHHLNDNLPVEYTENIYIPIAFRNGIFNDPVNINKDDLFPSFTEKEESGKFYYLVPLHFAKRCLGYMVLGNCRLNLHTSMFQSWCITISNSLENIRKIISLNSAVKHLGKLYAQDTFVGIFNRNGFMQETAKAYEDCVNNQRSIMLMFIDLDGLKKINDGLGHDVGDKAICDIADVLIESCQNEEVYCRFGGDEFIVFAPDRTEEDAQKLTDVIQRNIEKMNMRSDSQYTLSASTGFIIAVPKEGEDLFKFVTEADKVMYQEKKKKKKLLNFREY